MGHRAGKLARLVDLIDRFGGPIEGDLLDRGFNILDWFTGRYPLSQLQRWVDKLPAHSRYVAALLDDPETAEQMALLPEPEEREMTMEGFGSIERLLSHLIDVVNQNTAAVFCAAGAEPPSFEPMPRPVTEMEKANNRRRAAARQRIVDQLLGRTQAGDDTSITA